MTDAADYNLYDWRTHGSFKNFVQRRESFIGAHTHAHTHGSERFVFKRRGILYRSGTLVLVSHKTFTTSAKSKRTYLSSFRYTIQYKPAEFIQSKRPLADSRWCSQNEPVSPFPIADRIPAWISYSRIPNASSDTNQPRGIAKAKK